jgi:hypothetical protein
MYGKLFEQMYDGTLRSNWQALVTFQQFVVLCNEDGVVDITPDAISARTGIPLEIITAGIAALETPDPLSRTPNREGRRIDRIDSHRSWGWTIVNHAKYRAMQRRDDKKAADRVRIAARRTEGKFRKNNDVAECRAESSDVANVAYADTNTDLPSEDAQARHSSSLWDQWKQIAGKNSAGVLVRAIKEHGEEEAAKAVGAVLSKRPAEPVSYFLGILKTTARRSRDDGVIGSAI